MQTYLETFDFDRLPRDSTLAQIKADTEETNRSKVKLVSQNSQEYKTANEAWDKFEVEYYGNDQTRQMEVLNMERDLEALSTVENEAISKCSNRISLVVFVRISLIQNCGEGSIDTL